jgi:hypothetical protein
MPDWTMSSAVAAVALLAASPGFAEAPPRVRGVVTGINDGTITVKQRDGGIVTLKTGANTSYAYVVPSSLDAIKVDDFVGAAVKGPPSSMVAVELALIPENMRAGRTNGLVAEVSPAAARLTDTNMTNGLVTAEKSGAAGRTLTVTYDGGSKSFRITVPPNAPIVRYVLADRSAVSVGSTVFIKINPGDLADLVTIGKGVTPPM